MSRGSAARDGREKVRLVAVGENVALGRTGVGGVPVHGELRDREVDGTALHARKRWGLCRDPREQKTGGGARRQVERALGKAGFVREGAPQADEDAQEESPRRPKGPSARQLFMIATRNTTRATAAPTAAPTMWTSAG